MIEHYVELPDGVRIRFAMRTNPHPKSDLAIVIATGRTEFCEKYAATLHHLATLGYDSIVFDWRGQGKSSRLLPNPCKGHITTYDHYLDDLEAVLAHAAQLRPGPLCLLGHSMGGHIALRALARWPGRFRGAVLSAPMIQIAGNPIQKTIYTFLAEAAVAAGLGTHYLPGRGNYGLADAQFAGNVLTHDRTLFEQTVNHVAADPRLALGGPTWAWLAATMRSIASSQGDAAAGRITEPVLILSAGDDRVVSLPAQAAFVRNLPKGQYVSIPSAYHELLQETADMRAAFWSHAEAFLAGLAAPAVADPESGL